MNGDKTRLKLTLLMIGVTFIEAVIRAAWPAFPITEAYSIQGIAYGSYMTAKTMSNMDEAKYANSK